MCTLCAYMCARAVFVRYERAGVCGKYRLLWGPSLSVCAYLLPGGIFVPDKDDGGELPTAHRLLPLRERRQQRLALKALARRGQRPRSIAQLGRARRLGRLLAHLELLARQDLAIAAVPELHQLSGKLVVLQVVQVQRRDLPVQVVLVRGKLGSHRVGRVKVNQLGLLRLKHPLRQAVQGEWDNAGQSRHAVRVRGARQSAHASGR